MTAVGADEDRGRPLCGAKRRQAEGNCRRPAGWGTPTPGHGPCKLHGGSTRNHVARARRILAEEAVERYGAPRRIHPRDGLIEEYWRTAGAIAYCERMVADFAPDDLMWGIAEETVQTGTVTGDEGGGGGPAGTRTKHRAQPNVWLQQLEKERKHFAALGVDMLKLDIDARRVEFEERHAAQLAGVVRLFVTHLGLTDEQQARVPGALRAAVSAMSAVAGQAQVA